MFNAYKISTLKLEKIKYFDKFKNSEKIETSSTNVEISDGPTKATLMKGIKKSISSKQMKKRYV